MTWSAVAAVMLTMGTLLQAVTSLREFAEQRRDLMGPALAVIELQQAFSWWKHPVRRFKQEGVLRELLRTSKDEAQAYGSAAGVGDT